MTPERQEFDKTKHLQGGNYDSRDKIAKQIDNHLINCF